MSEKICLSLFDIRFGPQVMFMKNMDEAEAKDVAMKSSLALSGMENSLEVDVDGILPLPQRDVVFYAYLFPLRLKEDNHGLSITTASLAILVQKSEASLLYQNVASLQSQAKKITDQIRKNYIYEPGIPLPQTLQKLLNDWNLEKGLFLGKSAITENYTLEPTTEYESKVSLTLLFRLLTRDLDKVVRAVIQGDGLIIAADDLILIKNFITALRVFVPHRLLNVQTYTETFVDPSKYDILGISPILLDHYPSTEFSESTVVDLRKSRVIRGKSDPYIRILLKQALPLPSKDAEILLQEKIKQLILDSIELVNAYLDPINSTELIQSMQKRMSRNEFDLVVQMALRLNPAIRSLEGLKGRIEAAIDKLKKF